MADRAPNATPPALSAAAEPVLIAEAEAMLDGPDGLEQVVPGDLWPPAAGFAPATPLDVPAPSIPTPERFADALASEVLPMDPLALLPEDTVPPARGTGLVYDPRMMLHATPAIGESHPERPERIAKIFGLLERHGCVARMVRIPSREALRSEVALVHNAELWDEFEETVRMPLDQLILYSRQLEAKASLYLNQHSTFSARISCGSVIEMCHAVATRRVRNGFAVVRPPGHHAEPNCGTGFCLYNNVAVAAASLLANPSPVDPVKRIMIVDWDVHHGNGTQRAFWNNPSVLYVSLHRYENASFYPGTPYANFDMVGGPDAEGTSLNVPWPCGGMDDADYLHAFQRCIMPVAYEFAPDMVIISAGFDAAEGDLLGGCHVSPAGYAHLTHQLAALANGRLVVALEGGYDLDAIANSALAVTRVLLGDAPPMLAPGQACSSAGADTVARVVRTQARYWRNLAADQVPHAPQLDARDVLAAQRSASLWAAHRMVPLPAIPAESLAANQVVCSPSLMEAKSTVLLVYVHDSAPIHISDALLDGDYANEPAVHFADASAFVAHWASERGYAVADMNTRATLPVRSLRNRDHDRAMPRTSEGVLKSNLAEQLLYVWDNFLALSPAKKVVFVAQGTGCDAVVQLIARRVVQERIAAMVQLMAYNPIPLVPKGRQELKAWYFAHSLVVCPREHPLYAWGEQSASGKRLGHTVRADEASAADLLPAVWGQVERFVEEKLA